MELMVSKRKKDTTKKNWTKRSKLDVHEQCTFKCAWPRMCCVVWTLSKYSESKITTQESQKSRFKYTTIASDMLSLFFAHHLMDNWIGIDCCGESEIDKYLKSELCVQIFVRSHFLEYWFQCRLCAHSESYFWIEMILVGLLTFWRAHTCTKTSTSTGPGKE